MKATKNLEMPATCVAPLYINGLRGRMLYLPPKSKRRRQMLLIYGHHANLERMLGLAKELSRYGGVTVPDLPGFGGMDSFYRIGEKPSLDNLADYLAAFIKLRYKRRRVSILAVSFGFMVATRMLQRYPELVAKVDLLVSLSGFVHFDDFRLSSKKRGLLRVTTAILARPLPAWCMRYRVLKKPILRFVYNQQSSYRRSLRRAAKAERRHWVNRRHTLWEIGDARTYMHTSHHMLGADLCNIVVDCPVYHIAPDKNYFLDNRRVEKHLSVIFARVIPVSGPACLSALTASATEAMPIVPPALRRLLTQA